MLRTIWGDNQRYIDTYWDKFDGRYYVAGDSAYKDEDGCHWIMGRIDDIPIGTSSAVGLYARYLKRIAAHSRNLISSVVNPFERIGYPE